MKDLNFFSKSNFYKKIFIHIILLLLLSFIIISLAYKGFSRRADLKEKLSFLEDESNLKKEREIIELKKSLEKEEGLSRENLSKLEKDKISYLDITSFLLKESQAYISIENIYLEDGKFNMRARSSNVGNILIYKENLEKNKIISKIKIKEIKSLDNKYEFMIDLYLEELYE